MQGFLLRIIQRRLRRIALGVTFGLAILTTTAVASGGFHDPKFDSADLAAEKAQILLENALCGNPGEKTTAECEKYLQKALDHLARVRESISAAAAAADGIGAQLPQLP